MIYVFVTFIKTIYIYIYIIQVKCEIKSRSKNIEKWDYSIIFSALVRKEKKRTYE